MRYRLPVAFSLALAALFLVTTQVFGGTYLNTIESTATLSGRHLQVTVIIGCDAGQRLTLRVTSTQRHVGAMAEGREQTICTGEEQHIPVDIVTRGSEQFIPVSSSDSRVVETCVLAMTSSKGKTDDSHQWCKQVALVSSH
ncbi:MAG: hypothetical protein WBW04_00290 [Nitrolancea sp.]